MRWNNIFKMEERLTKVRSAKAFLK
ncbi:hypothetical protein V6Z15_14710 [Leptospira borgpetersenii]|nr:hypothetical protein [Leptospira borgpetersenii]